MDGQQLADFLRARRAAVRPAGATTGGLRRVAGLRREEVAELARISVDYYTRLEQNRTSRPSPQVVAALAEALEMNEAQRAHLFRLAEHPVQPPQPRTQRADPALLRILEQLDRVPAHVMTDLGETLAQNRVSIVLFGDASVHSGVGRSTYYRWFTDPAARQFFAEDIHERESRARVAELRATLARRSDAPARDLVARLRVESREFAALWDAQEVATRISDRKRVVGPTGLLDLHSQFLTAGAPDQLLVVFTPVAGTDSAERLGRIG
ncbi:helix-turn-helix transcriptional regulator [Micromonospora sp. NBC_00389]|uniref:helix-turn-helix transcriptional regulator n=1 Tax=Micromonospora sp. NBC_00389 TaxID=2903586 RepID=UPI002E1D6796